MNLADPSLESPSSSRPSIDRVSLRTLVAWGPPIVGLSSGLFLIQFFFLKFATDVLFLSPAVVGALFAAGRLWDAFSDPLVGTLSDRTRSRIGRRRPWMFAAIPLLVGFTWMIWMPPIALSGGALVAWVSVALFGFYTAFTFYQIPHLALGAELTSDHHDRTRIFGVQSAFFILGMVFAFGGMQIIMNSGDQRAAAAGVAWLLSALVVLLLAIPPSLVQERAENVGRGALNPFRAMRDVFSNLDALRLVTAQLVFMIGVSVVGLLSPYIVEYVLKRPDLVGPLPAAFLVASIASIPVWVRISARFGKRNAWVASMALAGLGFGSMSFAKEGDVLLLACLLPFVGFANGCGGVVAPSILADVIDGDELATGERKEGAYNAAFGLAIKVANAFMILVTGFALEALGFAPGEEQSGGVKLGLRLLYGGMPLVMCLAGAFVLSGLRMDESKHARIREALDVRRESAGPRRIE